MKTSLRYEAVIWLIIDELVREVYASGLPLAGVGFPSKIAFFINLIIAQF